MMTFTTQITNKKIHLNLPVKELVTIALAQKEGELASNQALNVLTGARTGRSPKDRFIVKDAITEKTVGWNAINQSFEPAKFDALWLRALDYLNKKDQAFVSYFKVGADDRYTIPVKVMAELAWQTIFAHNMFIRPKQAINSDQSNQWTILIVPGFKTDPARDGVNSDAAVILNFSRKCLLICGTYYAGEMKKGMFSVLNFMLPEHEVLPMHCAANVGKDGKEALFR